MYKNTIWRDHVQTPDDLFTLTKHPDGNTTIKPAGKVLQEGTPQDEVHFNNMEKGILDAHTAALLLLNYARQNHWEVETGTISLINKKKFPFNDSLKSVALQKNKENGAYLVLTEIVSTNGNTGDVVISDKLANGFKIAYTGSATAVTIKYTVIGGYLR